MLIVFLLLYVFLFFMSLLSFYEVEDNGNDVARMCILLCFIGFTGINLLFFKYIGA